MKTFLSPGCPLHKIIALLVFLLAAAASGLAREHAIPPSQLEVDGVVLGLQPGDVLAISAGARPYLRLVNLTGSALAPITVINRGGAVIATNDNHAYNIKVSRSRYVRLTGTGEPGCRFGFVLGGTAAGGSALMITDGSSDCEVDHLHILKPGYAGMLIKTDGAPGMPHDRLRIHDNYIHDTPGEGMYIGETKRQPGQVFRHVEIWNNVVARTGYESCQLAHTVEDVRVHHNVFYQAGLRGDLWQDGNFQLGSSAACEFSENIVIGGNSRLVVSMGGLPKVFRNNYFAACTAGPAFQIGDSDMSFVPDSTVTLQGNFFRDIPAVQAVVIFTGAKSVFHADGNRWDSGRQFIKAQPIIDLGKVLFIGENFHQAVPAPRFTDEAHDDFRLQAGDPYLALGIGLLTESAEEGGKAQR